MYVPSIHKPDKEEEVFEYIKRNGFATLIGRHEERSIASHIPMSLDFQNGSNMLLGHVALNNEIKHCLDGEQQLLAIFMETHAYISSSWYRHLNVPTWNYISVHIYGKAKKIGGKELDESIERLVNQYEDGREARFSLSDMSEKMRAAHFKGLIGFKMSIDRIESAYKLSQNRNEKDYQNIIHKLESDGAQGSMDVAKEMRKLRSK